MKMSWTERVATRLAKQIKTGESPFSVGEISHGIEIVIMYLLNALTLLLSAYLLDVLLEASLLAGFYILHRSFTGGIHLKSVWTCMIGGVSMILLASILVKYLPDLNGGAYLLVFLLIACSFVINYRYAPAEHTYVSTKESIKRVCRKIVLGLLIFGCLSSEILVYFDYSNLALTYAFATFLQSLHLHPLSYQLVVRLENHY